MNYRSILTTEGGIKMGLWRSPTADGKVALLLGREPQNWFGGTPSRQARTLVNQGYWAVAVGTPNWGSQTDMDSIDAALNWVNTRFGKDIDRIIIVAHNAGCVVALNWAVRHHDDVAGISLQSPIIDLEERWTRVPADRTSLQTAYGGSQANFEAAMLAWNPAHIWRAYMTADLLGDRMQMWWSSSDTQTPPSVTANLATRYRATTGTLTNPDPTQDDPESILGQVVQAEAVWTQQPAHHQMRKWTKYDEVSEVNRAYKGGDACSSTVLPDGRTIFTFADTFIGTLSFVNGEPDGTYNFALPTRNSLVILDSGGSITGQHYFTPTSNRAYEHPEDPDKWYWPIDHLYSSDYGSLLIGSWLVTWGGPYGLILDSVILRVNPTTLDLESVTPMNSTTTHFYIQGMVPDGAITYILGQEYVPDYSSYDQPNASTRIRIARVASAQLLDVTQWQYWNGTEWVAGEANADPLRDNTNAILEGDGALRRGASGEFILAVTRVAEPQVRIYTSPNPQGPWTQRSTVPRPEIGERYGVTAVGYHPKWHPELDPEPTQMMLSWNGNLFPYGQTPTTSERDYTYFSPHFIVIPEP